MSSSLREAAPYAGLGSPQLLGRRGVAPEPIAKNWPARIRALLMVCGGRDYADSAHVFWVLDELQPCAVVHGACGVDADRPRWARLLGADRLADAWCARRQVPVIRVPARWSALGRRRGGPESADARSVSSGAAGRLSRSPGNRRSRASGARRRGPGVEAGGAAPDRSAALGGATEPGGMTA